MDKEQGKLSKRLDNFGQEPGEGVWNALEAQLAAKRRKPRGLVWWMLPIAAGVLLLISGLWFFVQTEKMPVGKEEFALNQSEKGIEKPDAKGIPGIAENENTKPLEKNSERQEPEKQDVYSKNNKNKVQENVNGASNQNQISRNQTIETKVGTNKPNKPNLTSEKHLNLPANNQEEKRSTAKGDNSNRKYNADYVAVVKSKGRSSKRKNGMLSSKNLINPSRESKPEIESAQKETIVNKNVEGTVENLNKEASDLAKNQMNEATNAIPDQENSKNPVGPGNEPNQNANQNIENTSAPDSNLAEKALAKKPTEMESNPTLKPDSQSTKSKNNWRKEILFSVRFPAMGTSFINQSESQNRISKTGKGQILERPILEFSLRLERNLLSWLAFGGEMGLVFQRDYLEFEKRTNQQTEIIAQGNQLVYKKLDESTKGNVQTDRIGNQLGFGFTILPGAQLPEIKIRAGGYFTIWERSSHFWNGNETKRENTFQFVSPYLMFSASKSITLSGRKFWIEPQFLWIPNSVFNYREGIKRQINYFGIGLGYRW